MLARWRVVDNWCVLMTRIIDVWYYLLEKESSRGVIAQPASIYSRHWFDGLPPSTDRPPVYCESCAGPAISGSVSRSTDAQHLGTRASASSKGMRVDTRLNVRALSCQHVNVCQPFLVLPAEMNTWSHLVSHFQIPIGSTIQLKYFDSKLDQKNSWRSSSL